MTRDELLVWLVQRIAQILSVEPRAIDTRERFIQYGFDSIATTRMVADLSAALGRPLPPTLAWEYPSIEALVTYLTEGDSHQTSAIPDVLNRGRNRSDESIAIVGMACRFPGGADDPRLFWRLLCKGFDGITEVPKNRWSIDESESMDAPELRRTYLRRGGFLQEIDGFDPLHFHISPREAEQMDPQQRLMLELSWEAIEDAGIAPETMRGSSTGVFTGVVFTDYDVIQNVTGAHSNQYTTTGSVQAVIANRISYVFGMSGPSWVINAACASSLLAVHLACQSIRNGECTAALAGGVQLNIAMTTSLGVSHFGALSPDGVCRTFDADAKGYVRGEGAGVILLRSLSEARRRGERIYAVIRGSASNNNGAGNGLTAPNPEAQRAVIVDAYQRAQVDPASVQYVELHGTGTILGDPIEASALGAAYTRNRQLGSKLLVGSVKTNIGHLEASAGIAGLMKTALSLHHRRLPPSLHYKTGNPYIDFEALRIEVVTAARAWPDTGDGVLRAGVSSFGFGGSNAHAILESWTHEESIHVLPLAAESPKHLEKLASRMRDWLVHAPESISVASVCSAAGKWLTSGSVRVALLGSSRAALAQALEQWCNDGATDASTSGYKTATLGSSRKPVFAFSGLGSQWTGMSRRVWDTNPAFVTTLRYCDAAFEPISGWSIVRTLFDDDAQDPLNGMDRLDVIVPVIVAVQIAMARLWMAWGIEPGAVIGHSVGEIAAAHVAGVLDLHEAMLIAYHTALAYRASVENGTGMLAFIGCPTAEIEALLGVDERDVHVAGQNDPHSCIVSGVATRVRALVEELTRRGIFNRILGNVYAHCPEVRAFTTNLSMKLDGLARRKPRVPLMSTVTGGWISSSDIGVSHWNACIEQPVQFRAGIEALWREGFGCFLEMSPHAILTRSISTTITAMAGEAVVVASQNRGEAERASLLNALGRVFEIGADVNWDVFMPNAASAAALPPDLLSERPTAPKDSPTKLLVLSARTGPALSAYAVRLGDHLRAHPELALADVAYGLATTRSAMEHRLAVVTTSREGLLQSLDAVAQGQTSADVERDIARTRGPKVVFIFPGQGSQWVGMGRQLYREEPAFREAILACDEAIRKEAGFSVLEELDKPEATSRLGETVVAQPALFTMEVALSTLLQSWGVLPSAVVGHSVGEIAAAHIAGHLDLEQAARLVSLRARIMQQATGHGKMASIAIGEEDARKAIAGLEDRVGIAAVNDPGSVVLSGDIDAVDGIVKRLSAREVMTRALRVNYAFHSPQMETLAHKFEKALAELEVKPGAVAMISTVTGKTISGEQMDVGYWRQNIRQTVRFADAVRRAASDGHELFIEVGPHPALTLSIEQTLSALNVDGDVIPTLRRDQDERKNALRALGALYVRGIGVDWRKLYPNGGRVVELPTYPWQRQRYWLKARKLVGLDARSAGQEALEHPWLHATISLPENAGLLLTGRLSLGEHPWLAEHAVAGRIVFPGTGFVELALAAANRVGLSSVEELTLETPMLLSSTTATALRVTVEPPDVRGCRRIIIHSRAEGESDDSLWTRHAHGILASVRAEPVGLMQWPPKGATPIELNDFYPKLAERSLEYGPAFRGLTAIWRDADSIYAEVRLPESLAGEAGAFEMHPALLDAAFQTIVSTTDIEEGHVYLPFQCGELVLSGSVAPNARVHTRLGVKPGAEVLSASIVLADAAGDVFATLSNIQLKRTKIEALRGPRGRQKGSARLYRLDWQELAIAAQSKPSGGTWLLLDDDVEYSKEVAGRLKALGAHVITTSLDAWLAAPGHFEPPVRVVWLCEGSAAEKGEASPAELAERFSTDALRLTQLLLKQGTSSRLIFVTRGAIPVDAGESGLPAHAPIWGYGRTLMREHPELECKLVDLDPAGDIQESLWKELCSTDEENQIVWRGGKRSVARLVEAPLPRGMAIPEGTNYALAIGEKGVLSDLRLEAAERLEPGAGEIEIEVQASGLNFRDVLNALGMYPGDAGPLGGECAGYVVAVGKGVENFKVGDRVMALSPGSFRAFVTLDARLAARIPKGLSLAQAATIPIVFLTAHYALHDLAKLRPGEHILIHAAAGGVGMAAVQVARRLGAKILATASSSKWATVRAMGVEHVANSRNLEFVQAFRDAAGRRVDVVLNSLAGEFVDASLSLLDAGGRFLEMGKTDIRQAETIARAHPGVTYRAFDLMEAGPERIRDMLAAIAADFDTGDLRPLPVRSFAITDAEAAFRFMAQARHTGKIALLAAPKQKESPQTVIVTGGLGALGLCVARWLWEQHRIAHLVLVGRSAPTGEKIAEIERLRSEGAIVTVAGVDVSDAHAVRALVDSIPVEQSLRGIIHAAGVLDDGIITEQTPFRFAKVFGPKVRGAWNLYEATRDKPLDFFVMFSSVAGVLGNAGQAAYAAANAFLDALASRMRASGKHALSLAWGPWDGAGMMATLSDSERARLRRTGLVPMSVADGLALFDAALGLPDTLLVPMSFDPAALARNEASASPLLRRLVPSHNKATASRGVQSSTMVLARIPQAQRSAHALAVVRQNAAEVLGLSGPDAVPTDGSLFELGLDSLMAVELRNRVAKALGIRLDASAILQNSKPIELVAALVRASDASTIERAPTSAPVPAISQRSTLHPLSAAQNRLYYLDHILERRETYNLQIAIRIDAVLSVDQLQMAIAQLVGRHDQLRMHVVKGPEGPQQRILPWVDVPVEEVDLRPRGEEGFSKVVRERAVMPFDLTKAPLLRVTLARLDEHSSGLLLVWHHIATDGWSIGRFLRELDAVYTTPDVQLPPAPSYPELVAARRLDDVAREEHRRWWMKYLEGAEPLDLPTDHAPGRRRRQGGLVPFTFDAALSDGIDALARTIGTTPFVVLLTGWALLMQRYCRNEDVTIAVISSGRTVRGAEDAIGLFVETIPVRCGMQSEQSVAAAITALRQSFLEALAHERLPLDEILGSLSNLRRGEIGETPLLRVCFVLEAASWLLSSFAGAKAELLGESISGDVEGTNKFDLQLAMIRGEGGYRASIEYAADLFDPDTIHRLAGHLRQVLSSMVSSPEKRLSDAEMLTAAERHRLLVEWNDTAREYPANKCVHELFDEQVLRTPDAIAVMFEQEKLTYAELNTRANQLAHYLRTLGVGPEILVGVYLERSIEMIVGLLAILKAGGAYVPLDPTYPAERLAFMLADARVRVLLTQSHLEGKLPAYVARVVRLDADIAQWAEQPGSSPKNGICPDNAAYVIYTSGSTGNPKGVQIPHDALTNLLCGFAEQIGIRENDVLLAVTSLSFDIAGLELWLPITCGATVHVASQEDVLDSRALKLAVAQATLMQATPTTWRMLIDAGWLGHDSFRALCGGEAMPPNLAQELARRASPVWNVYGPTETTIWSAAWKVDALPSRVSLGRGIANTQLNVLDGSISLLPTGVPGELYIAGMGLARGYLNRPGLTAERFIPDPFGPPGSRMYRTGDLARWRADGNLEYLGRIDHQVKVRGFRIELGEIESALATHPSVRACVVKALEDRPGDKRLVAYVMPNENEGSISALRAHLAARLPDYMLPSAFVFLDALPLTPNGKIDRKALPVPDFDRPALSRRFVAARTRLETTLTNIWADVLGVAHVGIHDNFFALGGNSLLGIRLISRAAKAGLVLTVRQLFESPTIDELAKALSTNKASTVQCLVPLRPSETEIPFVLTPGLAGTSMVFLPLCDALRVTMPIWSFDDPYLAQNPVQPETIEELARLWVAELLDTFPHLPAFRLGGYSFGGMVAVEMARQLIALGKRVECVLILDGGLPNYDVPFDPLAFLRTLAKQLGAPVAVRSGVVDADIEAVLGCIATALGTRQESGVDDPRAWARATIVAAEKNHQRMMQWQVRPVDVPSIMIRASTETSRVAHLGWSKVLGRPVQVLFVPGDHQTMMTPPFVQTLALCIEGLLGTSR